jgi:cytochrome b561
MKKSDVWPPSLRFVHWASAALVVAALGLGTFMVQLVHDPAERFELTQTHKSIGITVLALTVLRQRASLRAQERRGHGNPRDQDQFATALNVRSELFDELLEAHDLVRHGSPR